ncbi:MAG: hypothetical protein QGI79_01910 [Dehalococcoidia bacterium]|nr:hypothetical protein [Dehalococcoidia bacterium]
MSQTPQLTDLLAFVLTPLTFARLLWVASTPTLVASDSLASTPLAESHLHPLSLFEPSAPWLAVGVIALSPLWYD